MSNTEKKEELYTANSGENDMKARPPKNRQADASKYAELFARELAKATIYDPAAGTARSSRTYTGKYTQESLYSYLQSPTTNEKNLRDASQYMYNVNTRYYRLLQYYAGIPTYAYVISPLNFDRQKVKPDTFRKQYMKTVAKLELMNIKEETRKQILTALKDGAYYGVRWSDSSSSFIQKLNPDYCQITHMSDGVFLFSYDMSKVTRETLSCYPPEFERMLSEYEGGGSKWQPVDPSISVCVKADASIPEYSLPPFAAVLPQLYVINDTQALQEASDELDNYKLLAGEVPTDSEGVPTMTYAEMLEYYRHISGNIGNRVGLAFAPFKLTSIDFSKSAAADAVDSTARAVSNFWSSCGTSALLHGAENNTAGVAKLAIKSDETLVLSILDQCERQINRYLKTAMGGTNRFKIRFLRTTVFNEDEMASRYKEALNYGVGASYYMATLDIPQYDIEGLSFIEDEILDIETILKPLKTASTRSVGDDNSGGRPKSDDTDLTESGEETRDADSNENR
jgi:hypothetical protein